MRKRKTKTVCDSRDGRYDWVRVYQMSRSQRKGANVRLCLCAHCMQYKASVDVNDVRQELSSKQYVTSYTFQGVDMGKDSPRFVFSTLSDPEDFS